VSAQYNLGFSMALRVVDGNNAIQSYLDPAKWADPVIVRVSEAVVVEPLSLEPGESPLGARVDVVCTSGPVLSRRQQTFRGHTDDPARWEDLERKFRGLVARRLSTSQTDAIVKAVAELEQLSDIGDLVDLTVGTSS
jgi:2-methylcitrate dehydratase PrpD